MQKKLLILGGQQKLCDIVLKAREMGIYTVVTDWYEDSPAKRLADKACMVSTSDVDAILELIKEEKIDGVITGYIDSTLPYYYEICRRAGLPCFLNEKILECCTNKRKFKQLCARIGIETIPEVDLHDSEGLEFPVLIKPVDNSGSKGITVCYEEAMVGKAVDRALRFSKSKEYLAERFLYCDYVAAYFTVQNGVVSLTMLMDKDMNRVSRGMVPYPTAMITPSRYQERFTRIMNSKIEALVKELRMQNGTFEIGFFVNGDHFYALELTARLTATREYLLTVDMSGMDTLQMYIEFALSGRFNSAHFPVKKASNSKVYCMLFFFIKEGIIERIDGMDDVANMRGVLNVLQARDVGAKIRADGSYGQLFAKIYLKADNILELQELITRVQDTVRVYCTYQHSMVITHFDASLFFRN